MALGLAAGALAGGLAACGGGGGGSSDTTPPDRSAEPGVTQVTAKLTDFHIALSQKTFKTGAYTFVAKNSGQHDHALEIEGPGGEHRSQTLAPGESGQLKVTLKSGSYKIYCPVDGHKDQGMKTNITVGGAGGPVNENPPKSNGY
ncbi:copper-binding protein [Streptomyces sp. H27-D2]|uniref:copper-binding protein n=1 Tax=Streptomyces sp. H27-D2 TaxID=3046304 RepID=UPI002DB9C8DD|nr:copper-binding protein [Streptomyces sp. H27-D2]MEC4019809.1 copper-binding protein [Streptomyces sp. H27-D2]